MKSLLLFPPGWSPVGPYLALPILKAYLKNNCNIDVDIRDLNVEFYDEILSSDYAHARLNRYFENESEKDSKTDTTVELIKDSIKYIEEAKRIMRSSDYFDLNKRNLAQNILKNVFFIISKSFHNTTINLNKIQLQYHYNSTEEVMTACSDRVNNPLIEYYEDGIIKDIQEKEYEFVALSISGSFQLIPAITLCKLIKEKCANVKYISLGGNFITRIALEKLNDHHQFFDYVDFILLYDGEEPLASLIHSLNNDMSLENVPNLYYHDKNGLHKNQIVSTDYVNDNVPDFDGFALDKYLMPELVLPLYTSRQCFNHCAFCTIPNATSGKYRTLPITKVFSNMCELSAKYNSRIFSFVDETFESKRMVQLSELILDNVKQFIWYGETRFSPFLTYENCKKIYDSGCRQIQFGLESYNQRVLDKMKKNVKIEWIDYSLQNCLHSGIPVHLFFMTAFPTETYEEALNSFNFTKKILDDSKNKYNVPYSSRGFQEFGLDIGSDVWYHPNDYGVTILENDPKDDLKIQINYKIEKGLTTEQGKSLADHYKFEHQVDKLFSEYMLLPDRLHISEVTWIFDSIHHVDESNDFNRIKLRKSIENINPDLQIVLNSKTLHTNYLANSQTSLKSSIAFYNCYNHYLYFLEPKYQSIIELLKKPVKISRLLQHQDDTLNNHIANMIYFDFLNANFEDEFTDNYLDSNLIKNESIVTKNDDKSSLLYVLNLITLELCKMNTFSYKLLNAFNKPRNSNDVYNELKANNIEISKLSYDKLIHSCVKCHILNPSN